MATITGGKVAYRRTTQPAPYESKTAEVELAFSLEDDEDAEDAATTILEQCRDAVHESLGLRKRK